MFEIIFLIYLSGRIGKVVAAKGQPKGKSQLILIGMWVGGEILGALIGSALSNNPGGAFIVTYLFALLGAAAGGWGAFRIAHGLPDASAEGAQPRKPVSAGSAILTCVLGMALGSLVFQALWRPLFQIFSSMGSDSQTIQVVVSILTFIAFFAVTGFILGGVFSGWKRQAAWTGWFALAGIAAGLVNWILPIWLPKSMVEYPLVWGVIGAIFAAFFGFLMHGEPGYQRSNPVVPLLLFGFAGYFLLILAYNWVLSSFVAQKSWAGQAVLGFSLLLGMIEGLIIGLGLELPRWIKPAAVVGAEQMPIE